MDDPAQAPAYSLRQLHYFVTVAETGTISEAALRLRVSQSAVSLSLSELERALRVQLCVRRKARGVTLTPSGAAVLRRAKVLLSQSRELEIEAGESAGGLVGPLAIGCYPTLGPTVLAPLLQGFNEAHPGVVMNFKEDTQDRLQQRLAEGELDVAVLYDLELAQEFARVTLVTRRPHVLLPAGHPMVRSGRATLSGLAAEPMVLLDSPPSSGHALRVCREAGISPTIRYRTVNFETARALVGRGLGWTVLVQRPEHDRTYEGLPVAAVDPVDARLDSVSIVLAWLRDASLSRRAQEFVRFGVRTRQEDRDDG